jgi:hypothetical protein
MLHAFRVAFFMQRISNLPGPRLAPSVIIAFQP